MGDGLLFFHGLFEAAQFFAYSLRSLFLGLLFTDLANGVLYAAVALAKQFLGIGFGFGDNRAPLLP